MNPFANDTYAQHQAAQRAWATPERPDEKPADYDDNNTYETCDVEAIRAETVAAIAAAEDRCKASAERVKASKAKADAADGDVRSAQAELAKAEAHRKDVVGATPAMLVERDRLVVACRDCLNAATERAKPLRAAATADRQEHNGNVRERAELYAVREGEIPMLVIEMRRQRRWQKFTAENDKDQGEIAAFAKKHDLYTPAVLIKHGLRHSSGPRVQRGGPVAVTPKLKGGHLIDHVLAEHSWAQASLPAGVSTTVGAYEPPPCALNDFTDDDKSLLACALARGTAVFAWGDFPRSGAPPTAHELAELAGMPPPRVPKEPPTHFAHDPKLLGRLKYALNSGGPIAQRWAQGMNKPLSLEEGRRARGVGTYAPPAKHVGGGEALQLEEPQPAPTALQRARDLEQQIVLARSRGDDAKAEDLTKEMLSLRAQASTPKR